MFEVEFILDDYGNQTGIGHAMMQQVPATHDIVMLHGCSDKQTVKPYVVMRREWQVLNMADGFEIESDKVFVIVREKADGI